MYDLSFEVARTSDQTNQQTKKTERKKSVGGRFSFLNKKCASNRVKLRGSVAEDFETPALDVNAMSRPF
jgi:hypothetical protein